MNIYICGDLHGKYNTIQNFYNNNILKTEREREENWVICLGDFGAQFDFGKRDYGFKSKLSEYPFKYFVIRGNHEKRASVRAECCEEPGVWEEIEIFGNTCLRETAFSNIYYALDEGGVYNIDGRKVLVIPGAYSVDKNYCLQNHWAWFADEQMFFDERRKLEKIAEGHHFDFVFSHTCPYSMRPTDLFLPFVIQDEVDNTMEFWMDELKEKMTYNVWCWGHYHADRIEAPGCEMFYKNVCSLYEIEDRWRRYREDGKLDWWLNKGPNFYMFVNK